MVFLGKSYCNVVCMYEETPKTIFGSDFIIHSYFCKRLENTQVFVVVLFMFTCESLINCL